MMMYENNDKFVGDFDGNGFKVFGILEYANGDKFSGDFEQGARKRGVMTFKSGDEFSGSYQDGVFEGSGNIKYANGDFYQGEFHNGCKHGQGVLTLAAESKTMKLNKPTAKVEDSQKEAVEEADFESGGVFTGDFVNDLMDGNGAFVSTDGSEYIGKFKEGLQHGEGLLITKDGTEMFGKWDMGQH